MYIATYFKLEQQVSMLELFGGQLEQYGIAEAVDSENACRHSRGLIDELGIDLWVWADDDGYVSGLVCEGFQDPSRILKAIAAAFNTKYYSEYEPQWWGYNTREEMNAAIEKMTPAEHDTFFECLQGM